MNTNHQLHDLSLSEDDLRQIDLLVDGELDAAAQRRLLARLEALSAAPTDDPWRQLALAHVEARAWRSDFSIARGETVGNHPATTSTAAHRPAPSGAGTNLSKALLAMAASALLAFGLGIYAERLFTSPAPPADQVVTDEAAPVVPRLDEGLVESPIFVGRDATDQDLFTDDRGPVMPLHLIERLREAGHEVGQEQIVPVDLEDGSRVFLQVKVLEREPAAGSH